MTDPEGGEEATLFPKTAGEKLRDARESQGLTLADVAARTRVPIRHLEAIENSDYSGLPSSTYSVGFAKAYARAVGADEVSIGRDVRGQAETGPRPNEYVPYELADPARLPPRGLTTMLAVLAVLLLIGGGIWYGTNWFRNEAPPPAPVAAPAEVSPAPVPATPTLPAAGQVTLTATDTVWLRLYDAAGKTLFQGELKAGDHLDVPTDADRPMINVGRPDQLKVTINGSSVPPLGTGERAIKDVVVSADALLARGTNGDVGPAAAGAPSAATGPAGSPGALPVASPDAAPTPARRRATGSGGATPGTTSAPDPGRLSSPPKSGSTAGSTGNTTTTAPPQETPPGGDLPEP